MPFTPAHAIAALPFRRTRLNTAALVVGCLSPDFEYFLRLSARGSFGHSVAGLFALDLPLSLLVLWLFERYVKNALYALTPGLFPFPPGPRSTDPEPRDMTGWLLAVVSILLGAATHILWDAFTHPTFWPYKHLSMLHERVAGTVELYKCLQYGSGVFGVWVLAFLWVGWIRHAERQHAPGRRLASMTLVTLASVGAAIRVVVGVEFQRSPTSLGIFLSEAVITFLALLWLMLVLYGAVLRQKEA